MFADLRAHPLKALLVLLIPALTATVYLLYTVQLTRNENDGQIGAVLDDTWIHVRFAANIAAGEGLSYNEGVLTSGATSPLWVLILAAAFKITTPALMQQVDTAIFLSAVGQIVAVLAITGFGWFITRRAWVGWLAGMITALTGRMVWMGLSGMEITTFTALCVLALWSHVDDLRNGRVFGWRTGILAALATLGRPEGYLLALLIGLEAIFLTQRKLSDQNDSSVSLWFRFLSTWRGALGYILLAGTYPLVCLLISGYPLPNTFRVKSQLGREWPDLPYAFFWQPRVDFGWLLILLAGVGLGWMLWRVWRNQDTARVGEGLRPSPTKIKINITGLVYSVWPILFVLAVLFMGADRYVVNNSRYVAPAIPFQALAASIGVMVIATSLQRSAVRDQQSTKIPSVSSVSLWFKNFVPVFLSAALLFFAFFTGRGQPSNVANDVRQLRTMHIAAGEWVTQNTAPDALIALNDVGAIIEISDRRVLDLEGLVSAEVIDAVRGTSKYSCARDLPLMRLMLQQRPALIGVFPWWYPCMTGWPDLLQPYHVFTIMGPTVIGGGEMVMYWPQWENWPIQAEMSPQTTPIDAEFEQGIWLVGYETAQVEGGLQVTLWWQAQTQPDMDYTVFVHLTDSSGEIISQHDSPPQDGRFLTSLWRTGDIIPDVHLIPLTSPLPPGVSVNLRVGLYPSAGGANLPRVASPIDQPDHVTIPLQER